MLFKVFIVVSLLIFSSIATAYYPTYVSGTNHLVEISKKKSGAWNSIVVINNTSVGKPIHDETKGILKSINKELFDSIESAARKGINGISWMSFRELKYVTLDGPLQTKLITQSNGVITAEVGGFSLRSEVKFELSLFTLYGKVRTSELRFAADYDVITGRVYNLRDIGNTRVDIDVDGNGIINSLVAEGIEVLEGIFFPTFIQDVVDDGVNGLVNDEYYIAGLESVIPTGKWMVAGVDLGVKIKEMISGVSAEKYVSIGISEKNHRYYTGWSYRTYYMNQVELDISGNYKVEYGNAPIYSTGSWINPCAGPGGAGSGCYEP